MRIDTQLAPLVLACFLVLSGCSQQKAQDSANGAVPIVTTTLVRSTLEQKNFGSAVALANQLTSANPQNADAWLAAADANAAAGNRLAALAAIEQSLGNGMRDSARLNTDGYLDDLRSTSEYQALLRRYGLQKAIAQAGDTSIDETSAGTVVRAGDVSVTLSNTK
jgi:predicted Zn-dependent protease